MNDSLSLEQQIIAALRRITRAIDLHSRLLLHEQGLTAPQLAALRTVQKNQPVTVGDIARAIHLSQATVTGILGRLENRGLVTRARGHRDRRSVLVELTAKGTRLVDAAPSLLQDRFRHRLGNLQEWEQTMILATLQRIAAMMDAQQIDASPVLLAGAAGSDENEVSQYLQEAGLEPPREEA